MLNLINHTDKDIDERIRKGWIKFSEFKSQLCAKGVSKNKKWLLFESVITSTVLYGSCSWTMNSYRRAKLLSAQSKMVRQMMGLHWWKSTAKWEAEQVIEDCRDYTTPHSARIHGCNEMQTENETQSTSVRAGRVSQDSKEPQTDGKNGPKSKRFS